MLARRRLLRLSAVVPFVPSAAHPGWTLVQVPDERVVLAEAAGPTRLTLPARRCRLLASFHLLGASCAAVRCVAGADADRDFDLLVVVGSARILAVEPWAGRAATGAHFTTRLDLLPSAPGLPGARGLSLRRDAASPNATVTVWERQSWTDVLAAGPQGLRDAPVRMPLPGTWQANVTSRRAAILARLAHPITSLGVELIADAAAWPWRQAG